MTTNTALLLRVHEMMINTPKAGPQRYQIDDLDVESIAAMMGCKPNYGLANRLNDLAENGALAQCRTLGDLLKAVLVDLQVHHFG